MIYKRVTDSMTPAAALEYLQRHGAKDPSAVYKELDRLAAAVTSGEAFAVFATMAKQTTGKTYLNLYVNMFPITDPDGVLGMGKYKDTGRPLTFKCDSPTPTHLYTTFQKLGYILEQTHGIRLDFSTLKVL